MITIRLPHDHFHAGKKYLKGDEFSFEDLDQYDWFVAATASMRSDEIDNLEKTAGTPEWVEKTIEKEQERLAEADDQADAEEAGE